MNEADQREAGKTRATPCPARSLAMQESIGGREVAAIRRPASSRKDAGMAAAAGLPDFEVAGRGALSAEDPKVGQGVWLWFSKPE